MADRLKLHLVGIPSRMSMETETILREGIHFGTNVTFHSQDEAGDRVLLAAFSQMLSHLTPAEIMVQIMEYRRNG